MTETDSTAADAAAATVLASVREARASADTAEAALLDLACSWADLHPAGGLADGAVLARGGVPGAETALPIAGEGAPLVSEFCVAELAAALRLPTRVGRELIGQALELRHRLPRTWARVRSGELPAWRARRIAAETTSLTPDAAHYVDVHIAPFAHRVGPAETERLVHEAVARHMPERAAAEQRAGADARHATVHGHTVSFWGTVGLTGELDLADALDLDAALATGASRLAEAGCEESLDVRRAMALADLAGGQQSLDLAPGTGPSQAGAGGRTAPRREVVLHVHLSEAAVSDRAGTRVHASSGTHLATTEQVRAWCRAPHAVVTVKPVLDLGRSILEDHYSPSATLAEQVVERDRTCVFPWCSRRADRCDLDHVVPYDDGGPTSSDNLAPLCRHHHRLKTHPEQRTGRTWTYTVLQPGTYLWASPHGRAYLRHHSGTIPLDTGPPGAD